MRYSFIQPVFNTSKQNFLVHCKYGFRYIVGEETGEVVRMSPVEIWESGPRANYLRKDENKRVFDTFGRRPPSSVYYPYPRVPIHDSRRIGNLPKVVRKICGWNLSETNLTLGFLITSLVVISQVIEWEIIQRKTGTEW